MPGPAESERRGPMRVLLDTHTLVWALRSPELLSRNARAAIEESEVFVSVASLWELITKAHKPQALLADPAVWWNLFVSGTDIRVIGIRQTHVLQLAELPELHRDPFDRILVAQAMVEKAAIISKDERLAGYGLHVVW